MITFAGVAALLPVLGAFGKNVPGTLENKWGDEMNIVNIEEMVPGQVLYLFFYHALKDATVCPDRLE